MDAVGLQTSTSERGGAWRESMHRATLRFGPCANLAQYHASAPNAVNPISQKRLAAMPATRLCFECAKLSDGADTVAPPKAIEAKPIATTFHLKRYLKNVGQKADAKSLLRTMVRVHYLFPHVSPAEMTSVFIQWCKQTHSKFDQMQIRQMVLDARQRVQDPSSNSRSPRHRVL
jgi:hypothetical protein